MNEIKTLLNKQLLKSLMHFSSIIIRCSILIPPKTVLNGFFFKLNQLHLGAINVMWLMICDQFLNSRLFLFFIHLFIFSKIIYNFARGKKSELMCLIFEEHLMRKLKMNMKSLMRFYQCSKTALGLDARFGKMFVTLTWPVCFFRATARPVLSLIKNSSVSWYVWLCLLAARVAGHNLDGIRIARIWTGVSAIMVRDFVRGPLEGGPGPSRRRSQIWGRKGVCLKKKKKKSQIRFFNFERRYHW